MTNERAWRIALMITSLGLGQSASQLSPTIWSMVLTRDQQAMAIYRFCDVGFIWLSYVEDGH